MCGSWYSERRIEITLPPFVPHERDKLDVVLLTFAVLPQTFLNWAFFLHLYTPLLKISRNLSRFTVNLP